MESFKIFYASFISHIRLMIKITWKRIYNYEIYDLDIQMHIESEYNKKLKKLCNWLVLIHLPSLNHLIMGVIR